MSRPDVWSQWSSASFMCRSTARRLRLRNFVGNSFAMQPWDFLEIQNYHAPGDLYVSLNGSTASSSLATSTSYAGQQMFRVPAYSTRSYQMHATSLSAVLTGASAAAMIVFVARY